MPVLAPLLCVLLLPAALEACTRLNVTEQKHPSRVPMARLAQSAERKALNLVVVGSSPTVGVLFTVLALAVTIHEAVQ